MRRRAADGDEVLFSDRARGRAAGEQRSRARAAALARWLGLDLDALVAAHPPTVIVTGSKGKGTAAAYASAALAAAGCRVGTLTSPGLGSNRERIRVSGRAIQGEPYAHLVARVAKAMRDALPSLPRDGYLAPTGLFTLAAVRHFLDEECDAWVLETGMGGASDEVSLFTGDVLALTPVFDEHIGVLGATVRDIAVDKIAAVPAGAPVLSAPQSHPEAADVVASEHGRLMVVDAAPLDDVRWPCGLSSMNAWLGVRAAQLLLRMRGTPQPHDARLRATLSSVRLPGRLSLHLRGEQQWLVDAAANPRAVATALRCCRDVLGEPSTVLVCFPDGKHIDASMAALRGVNVIALRVDAPHLTFRGWNATLRALDELGLDALGPRVLALGTVSFVAQVLAALDVDTEVLFDVSRG